MTFPPGITVHTSRAARRCAGHGGTREAQPRFAFPQRMRKIRVVPRLMRRFGEAVDHNGEGSTLREKSAGIVETLSTLDVHPPGLKGGHP